MSRVVLVMAILVLVYALTLGSFAPADLAVGAAVAAAVLLGFRRLILVGPASPAAVLARRAFRFVPLALATAWLITVGTWQVSLVVLRLRPLHAPGIVAVPFDERSPTGVAATALLTTLSPGEFLVEIDWERSAMLFHVLDAADPDAVREHHRWFYDRFQRHVFP